MLWYSNRLCHVILDVLVASWRENNIFGFFRVRHANRGWTKYSINIMLAFMLYAMLTCLDPCIYAYVYMFICLYPCLHMFLCLDSFFTCLDLHPYMLTCLDLHVFMPFAVFSCFDLSFPCIVV